MKKKKKEEPKKAAVSARLKKKAATKKKVSLTPSVSATDADVAIHSKTIKELASKAKEARSSQRITKMITEGEKDAEKKDQEEEEEAASSEPEPVVPPFKIAVGEVLPKDNRTITSRINPYSTDSIDVGLRPSSEFTYVPVAIRIDPNNILRAHRIAKKDDESKGCFCWSLTACRNGEDPEGEITTKKGKKTKHFNFSGKKSKLLEIRKKNCYLTFFTLSQA